MDCIRVSQNLYDYLDGEVGRWRRQAISRHLDSCPACAGSVRFEVRLRQALWSACLEQPPPELRARILGALATAHPGGAEGPDVPGSLSS